VSASPVVLSAEGLAKRYGDREVVTDASFELHRGEVFGFLGPNGAGKTTTIRMLVGLVKPTRGRVVFDGHDITTLSRAALRPIRRELERAVSPPLARNSCASCRPRMTRRAPARCGSSTRRF